MKIPTFIVFAILFTLIIGYANGQSEQAINPVIHADVPDMSMIRVGDTYYMSSTTMHMAPGVPIMKSKDLVNWEIVNYAYDVLDTNDLLTLSNDKNSYGRGSWASSLRFHKGTYYVSTFAATTGKTHIYTTQDIEKGPWKEIAFQPSMHDHSLVFEDDKVYLIWGAGKLSIVELEADLSGVKPGTERVMIENATEPAGSNVGLRAEGSQIFKVNDKYYLFNIAWPRGGMRTVIIHRADQIEGPWEGRVALKDKGVAQGGLIDTSDGDWFAYLFRDNGAVGRIPYLVPVTWEDGWPVLGVEGKVPMELELDASKGLMPGIVASDDFKRKKGQPDLPLVWQWNHNPVDNLWSVNGKKGFLRIITDRIDTNILSARNMLTQRTIGPESMGTIKLETSGLNEGDFAGLALLQKDYGFIGVQVADGQKMLVMKRAEDTVEKEIEAIPLTGKSLSLRAVCDFNDRKDQAKFYFSTDNGKNWTQLGDTLQMKYTLPHFMGYRFGLFYYSTKKPGGHVDFDDFEIDDQINL